LIHVPPDTASVAISVALVTRNRPDKLERTLLSLRTQGEQPFEVLVSDDSDDALADDSRAVAEAYGCDYARGPGTGLYANRNAVARRCRGTHIRTMDDDHLFPDGHWARCRAAVREDPESVWIIGEIIPAIGQLTADDCPGELHPRGFSVPPRDTADTWAIADGASIYPARIFDGTAQFSEAFRFGLSYLEFGSRLRWLGYRIRHLEGTYIIHETDGVTRSIMDPEEHLGSRFFAMLSHSFTYQPSLMNKGLTSLQLAYDVVRNRRVGLTAIWRGMRAYRQQRRSLGGSAIPTT
jgi:glycosyltransferase involved in cell wall biosynthesis